MFRFWVFTIPGPKGTLYVPSGILTGASSECLLEFDTRSNPLSHHVWISSHGYCTQFCSILPFEGQGKCSLDENCKSVCSYCIMMKTVVKIAPPPSQDPHKVRFTNVKTLLSNSLTGTYNIRKKTGIVELGESQPRQIFEQ